MQQCQLEKHSPLYSGAWSSHPRAWRSLGKAPGSAVANPGFFLPDFFSWDSNALCMIYPPFPGLLQQEGLCITFPWKTSLPASLCVRIFRGSGCILLHSWCFSRSVVASVCLSFTHALYTSVFFFQCCSHISLQKWKTTWFIFFFKLGNWGSGQECNLFNVNKDSGALVSNLYFLPRLSFNKINLYFDFSIFLINEKPSLRGKLELTCSLTGQCS